MKIKLIIAVSLVVLAVIWWRTKPDNKTRVIFCDVGQGDGILVSQKYFQMIIDAGPKNGGMVRCLGKHLPFWDKKIEAAVITHGDADHSGGQDEIKKFYRVENLSTGMRKGEAVSYGEIAYEVLSPDTDWGDDNKNSTVGILGYKDFRILLMADVPAEVEQKMVWRQELTGTVEVLKVSHHGSAEGTSEELLAAVRPGEAVISVGKNNKFGHPNKEVIERLQKMGITVRRTDLEGEVVYTIDK